MAPHESRYTRKVIIPALTSFLLEQGLKESEFWLRKIHGGPMQAVGTPDTLGCIRSRMIGMEVKRPDQERGLTKKQRETLTDIRAAGGFACCVRDENDIRKMFGLLDSRSTGRTLFWGDLFPQDFRKL